MIAAVMIAGFHMLPDACQTGRRLLAGHLVAGWQRTPADEQSTGGSNRFEHLQYACCSRACCMLMKKSSLETGCTCGGLFNSY